MTTATPEKAEGLKALQNACDEIQKTITNSGGVFQIKMAVCVQITYAVFFFFFKLFFIQIVSLQPKVVTATDEAELARQMEKAEVENAEVAGDDDEEEEEEEEDEEEEDGEEEKDEDMQNGGLSDGDA